MLLKTVAVFALLVVVFLVVALLQPSTYRVVRTATIAAPAAVVFAQVNDFHAWSAWSPWEHLDPAMKKTFGGAPAGAGATYAWAGNSKAGEGTMAITESRPNERIKIDLEFIKPFAAQNGTEFAFSEDHGQTGVSWSMTGSKNLVMKAMGLFMSMDKMIGGDFERGLANLKAVAENAAKS